MFLELNYQMLTLNRHAKYPNTVELNKLLPTYKPLLFILTIDPPFIWNTCDAPID